MASIIEKLYSRSLLCTVIFIALEAPAMSSENHLTTDKTAKDWKNDYNRHKTYHKTSKHFISGSVHFFSFMKWFQD